MSIEIRATLEVVRVYKSLKKKYPEKYLEIQELKKVIVIRPMLGDKIQKKLWPKKYVQHGISNLFRLELSDGWRLLYTVTHQGKTTFCIILDICDHKEYEKLFRY